MRYRSTFVETDGSQGCLVLDACDEQSLHELLHAQGRMLLHADHVEASPRRSRERAIPERNLLLFAQGMENCLSAGVPLLAALEAIEEQEPSNQIKKIYSDLNRRVAAGETLSSALMAHPKSFSSVDQALVRAGERSGQLPDVFGAISTHLEWQTRIRSTVRQAMAYPLVVLVAGYGLIMILLAFVLPRLHSIIIKIGGDAPWISRQMFSLSEVVANYVPEILIGSVLASLVTWRLLRTDCGRCLLAGFCGKLPVVAQIIETLNLANFCRHMSTMLRAGLSVPDSLELTSATLSLPKKRAAAERAKELVLGGARFTEAIAQAKILQPIALGMVRVGEEAGCLPESFDRLSRIYERDVKVAVKRAITLLEPAITAVLGLLVGGVAIIVITTIYTALGGLRQ